MERKMKKLIALLLMAVSMNSMAFQARIDLNGGANNINLKGDLKSSGCVLTNPGWVKDNVKRNQQLFFRTKKLNDTFEEFNFTFTPDNDGIIQLRVSGEWYNKAKKADPKLIYLKGIQVTGGSTISNGDFKEMSTEGTATSWTAREQPAYSKENSSTILKMEYSNGIAQNISVKKGVPTTVSLTVKSAMLTK